MSHLSPTDTAVSAEKAVEAIDGQPGRLIPHPHAFRLAKRRLSAAAARLLAGDSSAASEADAAMADTLRLGLQQRLRGGR